MQTTSSTDIFPHDSTEIAAQPASSSMAPRARSSQHENTRARWKKRERTPSWCATHWRLASIFLRLCSRNDFASPSASHPCAHAFQSTPPSTPFSLRRFVDARFLASVLLPLSISSFLATSQPSAIRLRRATFRRFLRVFRLASIFFPNKLFVPCEFIYFYQRAQRSWEPGQRFVSFLESIKPYGLLIALICFFSRRYLSLFVISMERLPLPIRRNHDSPFPLYTIRLPYRSASFTVVVRFHFQQNIFLSKLKSIENCPFHPSFPRLRLFI